MGGSCSGKSRVCAHISQDLTVPVYDMDARIFGSYFDQYDQERHAATCEWFHQENGLDWVLSLSWTEFDGLNAAVAAEYLDLFADEVSSADSSNVLVVDGGLARPSVLAGVIQPAQIVYLQRDEIARASEWESNETRLEMKRMILELNSGAQKWRRFLEFDKLMTQRMREESEASGARIISVDEGMPASDLARKVLG
jgi:hypothetical protein